MNGDKTYLKRLDKVAKDAASKLFAGSRVVSAKAEEGSEFDGSPTVEVLVVLDEIKAFDAVAWAKLDLELQEWLKQHGIERSAFSRVLSQAAIDELQES